MKSNAIVFQKLLSKLCTNTLNAAGAAEVTCTEHTHALSPRKTLRATSYFAAAHIEGSASDLDRTEHIEEIG